ELRQQDPPVVLPPPLLGATAVVHEDRHGHADVLPLSANARFDVHRSVDVPRHEVRRRWEDKSLLESGIQAQYNHGFGESGALPSGHGRQEERQEGPLIYLIYWYLLWSESPLGPSTAGGSGCMPETLEAKRLEELISNQGAKTFGAPSTQIYTSADDIPSARTPPVSCGRAGIF
ncbi:hypothetical protein THAOC_27025, partial [Thalassiosira oceanica]